MLLEVIACSIEDAVAAWIVQCSRAAAPGVEMVAGGGVDLQAIQILSRAGVSEAHAGRRGVVAAGRGAFEARPPMIVLTRAPVGGSQELLEIGK